MLGPEIAVLHDGAVDRIADLARRIVASRPDVILEFSGPFIREVMAMATGIPMVGTTADPVEFGFTTSLARPDRNGHLSDHARVGLTVNDTLNLFFVSGTNALGDRFRGMSCCQFADGTHLLNG